MSCQLLHFHGDDYYHAVHHVLHPHRDDEYATQLLHVVCHLSYAFSRAYRHDYDFYHAWIHLCVYGHDLSHVCGHVLSQAYGLPYDHGCGHARECHAHDYVRDHGFSDE